MKPIYLCGPINGRSDDDCRTWREQVKAAVGAENCLDPMRRDYRGREAENVREIVELDKADVDACGVVLAYFDKPSVGTSMEILYAWEHGTRVVLIDAQDRPLSPWLLYHTAGRVRTVEAGIAAALEAV